MPNILEFDNTICPITAIAFVRLNSQTLLFAGEGPFLRVFDHPTDKVLIETRVFTSQSIHGIAIGSPIKSNTSKQGCNVLIWGGRSIRAIQATSASRERSAGHDGLWLECIGSEAHCSDWILDGAFNTCDLNEDNSFPSQISAIFVTAHNNLWVWTVQKDQASPIDHHGSLRYLSAGPRSILDSAHVLWLTATHVLIAAGTCFGEVLLWSSHLRGPTLISSRAGHLHCTFTGHEGSVFGVQISPKVQFPGSAHTRRLLASCSDDRTIRVWETPDLDSSVFEAHRGAESDPLKTRETGFCLTYTAVGHTQAILCLASVWGHASRIWGVNFLPELRGNGPLKHVVDVLSFGEDATAQRWSLSIEMERLRSGQTSPGTEAQLKHVSSSDFHSGKSIWCSAVLAKGESSWVLATGGADGKIVSCEIPRDEDAATYNFTLTEISTPIANTESGRTNRMNEHPHFGQNLGLHAEDTLCQSPKISPSVLQHHLANLETSSSKVFCTLKSYVFVQEDVFLATTESGLVALGSLHRACSTNPLCTSENLNTKASAHVTWTVLQEIDNLKSYSLLASVPQAGMAFLGGAHGTVYWYDHPSGNIQPMVVLGTKISGLFAQYIRQDPVGAAKNAESVVLVAALLGSLTAYSWFISRRQVQDDEGPIEISKSWALELPPAFVVTSSHFLLSANLLILGARNGALAVYDLSSPGQTKTGLYPEACFRYVQEVDAVTVILTVPDPEVNNKPMTTHILTAGRNGTYSIHRLSFQQDVEPRTQMYLETVHLSTPSFGPNIEGAQFHPISGNLILWGFHGKDFVVWNDTTQSETMTIDCGGAHRSWAYLSNKDEGGSLIWTKASKLNLHRQWQPSHQVVKEGGHGREIKALAISSPLDAWGPVQTKLIITGAEDTTLRLFAYEEDPTLLGGSRFRCFGVFRKHTTGVQHLQWCGSAGFLFSSGGAEELFVWRVRKVCGFGVGMICEAKCSAMGKLSDLRVMSFHVLDILDKKAATSLEACFLICVVFSNSTIRVYLYSSSIMMKKFDLLLSGTYGTCCLTQAHCFVSSQDVYIATAGTDGYIAFWNLTEDLRKHGVIVANGQAQLYSQLEVPFPETANWQTRTLVHQSAVKCMTLVQVPGDGNLIVTGGDDNALAFTCVKPLGTVPTEGPQCSTLLIPKAHASAITAITFVGFASIRSGPSHHLRFATSSNDQRLKLWSAYLDLSKQGVNGLEITKDANVYTSVADVSSMDLLTDKSKKQKVFVCGVGVDVWSVNESDSGPV
ncbi:MAG: hypothetical protein M1830_008302 [Pleopsidium flavum]|nr:MAG: hypothetical protein M1830_008302 [Pleopsidium flavum]